MSRYRLLVSVRTASSRAILSASESPHLMLNPTNSNNRSNDHLQSAPHPVEKARSARSMIPALNLGSMTCSLVQLARIENALWFCLKTQPKHEHLAATALRRQLGIQCF